MRLNFLSFILHDIGIRIGDDAVLTDDGCELITRDLPVKADEIEALMRA